MAGVGADWKGQEPPAEPPNRSKLHKPDPRSVSKSLDEEREVWSKLWQRDQGDLQATRHRLDAIRRDMWTKNETGLQLTVAKLQKVVTATKKHAGKGPDMIDKQFAQRLPPKCWAALSSVLQMAITLGIVPIQMLHTWVALIPKPQGRLRPIALLCMCYRWLLKAFRPEMAEWDQQEAPP